LARLLQPVKQERGMLVIDAGMQIDVSDEHPENSDSASLEILAPGSNVNFERPLQLEKHDFEIVSIVLGRQISLNE
jgi:hypothetical protein